MFSTQGYDEEAAADGDGYEGADEDTDGGESLGLEPAALSGRLRFPYDGETPLPDMPPGETRVANELVLNDGVLRVRRIPRQPKGCGGRERSGSSELEELLRQQEADAQETGCPIKKYQMK